MAAEKPFIAARRPLIIDLAPGEYRWCSCGRSEQQPFCDDSHRGTSFTPIEITLTERKRLYLCQCKHTGNPPRCDGTHGDV